MKIIMKKRVCITLVVTRMINQENKCFKNYLKKILFSPFDIHEIRIEHNCGHCIYYIKNDTKINK